MWDLRIDWELKNEFVKYTEDENFDIIVGLKFISVTNCHDSLLPRIAVIIRIYSALNVPV